MICILTILAVNIFTFSTQFDNFSSVIFLDPIVLAFFIGQLARIFKINNNVFYQEIPYEKLLSIAIIIMGSQILLSKIRVLNLMMIFWIVVCILGTYYISIFFSKIFGIKKPIALLLIAGNCICGPVAIAFASKVIKSNKSDISTALWINTFSGFILVILLPLLGKLLEVSPYNFGLWAGSSIQSTAQVISSAAIYSESSLQTAIIIKSLRILLLTPFLILLSLNYQYPDNITRNKFNLGKSIIPSFLFKFLVVILIANIFDLLIFNFFSNNFLITNLFNLILTSGKVISKFLLCLVVFEISMNFNIFNIKNFAPKLQIYSLISSFILLILSYRFLVI